MKMKMNKQLPEIFIDCHNMNCYHCPANSPPITPKDCSHRNMLLRDAFAFKGENETKEDFMSRMQAMGK